MKLRYHVLSKKADSHHDACLSFSFLSPACMFVPPLRRGKCGEGESRESAASQLGQEDPQQPSARSVIPLSLLFACLLFRMQFQKQSLLVQKGSAVTCQLVESSRPSWSRTLGRPPMAASTSAVCGKPSWGRGTEHSSVGNVFIRCLLCNTDDNYIRCPFAPIYDCGENRILKMESS